jgi:2,4-dienoyl-CoA reductase-like NADH-dependent reductase (Old Yellow Enzyme family)
VPVQMSLADIHALRQDFKAATQRAIVAGFDVVEMHAAHGYLLHSFLSPLSNTRGDHYGGSREGRARLLLEISQDLRTLWPKDKPMFVRLSCVDDLDGGWTLEDSIWLACQLRAIGVDVIDCSSGGILGAATSPGAGAPVPRTKRALGFQVPWAKAIKEGAQIATMAVGLILTGTQAEKIVASGEADLVAIGREALNNPNWPVHAAQLLQADAGFALWPKPFGWWLNVRQGILDKLGVRPS